MFINTNLKLIFICYFMRKKMGIINNVNFYKETVPEIFEELPVPPVHSRVVIIGSGFGGSITAHRLAQAGIGSTILERGSYWPRSRTRTIFSNETMPDGRGFWHKKGMFKMLNTLTAVVDDFGGVADVTSYENIDVWRGACVGGGSIVFTGVMIQPEREYFDILFNNVVNYDEMDSVYYPLVRKELNLAPIAQDIYDSAPFGHSRVWDQQSRKAGYHPYKTDTIFSDDVVRDELDGKVRASAIIGESTLGNSNGAKFDLTQNYLKYAQDSGLAKVFPGQQVKGLSYDGTHYHVDVDTLHPDGTVLHSRTLTCEYLFLAAGSIGTSELLVKAKSLGEIPDLNDAIGKGWGTNGDALVARSFGRIEGFVQAAPSASKIDDKTSSEMPVTLENWYVPGIPVNIGVIGSLGMAFDVKNRGEFVYDQENDKVELLWSRNGNDEAVEAIRKVNTRIADASLGVPGVPLLVPDVSAEFTAHPLGGAVIGQATDNYGRVLGTDKLYVMDGALMPGSAGLVNPSLTISALAERNIAEIVRTDFIA